MKLNRLFGDTAKKSGGLEKLIEALIKMDDKDKMKNFLEGILTPKELLEFPHRLEIVELLKKGISHHDIAGKLGVGVATVTRGSQELQKGRFKYV